MAFTVLVAALAEADLAAIHAHIRRSDGAQQAGAVLARLEEAVLSLARLLARGNRPPELERIGVRGFREIHVAPWRIISELRGREGLVLCVLDARRDVQSQLAERLLR